MSLQGNRPTAHRLAKPGWAAPDTLGRVSIARNKLVILFALVLLAIPSTVSADISPEGEQSVQYCFQVLNGDQYPDYVFLVYFRGAIERYTEIFPGSCILESRQWC